jgi:sugar lactone lactonase YvrE
VHPDKSVTVFADVPANLPSCPGGVGLTTAMVQLSTGWVLVGSLPTSDGKMTTAGNGCLIELSPAGTVAGAITGPYLNGPWDAALADNGDTATLFVTNTLVGVKDAKGATVNQGTVVRLSLAQTATEPPKVTATTEVAGGFPEREDAAALVKGPTGVTLDPAGTLYVGDNLGNRVAAVPNALTRNDSAGVGTTVSQGGQLANPLAVRIAPNGNLLVANATNGKIVEITVAGKQLGEFYANHDVAQSPPGNGNLFGIAVTQAGDGVLFVNDDTNLLSVLRR